MKKTITAQLFKMFGDAHRMATESQLIDNLYLSGKMSKNDVDNYWKERSDE